LPAGRHSAGPQIIRQHNHSAAPTKAAQNKCAAPILLGTAQG